MAQHVALIEENKHYAYFADVQPERLSISTAIPNKITLHHAEPESRNDPVLCVQLPRLRITSIVHDENFQTRGTTIVRTEFESKAAQQRFQTWANTILDAARFTLPPHHFDLREPELHFQSHNVSMFHEHEQGVQKVLKVNHRMDDNELQIGTVIVAVVEISIRRPREVGQAPSALFVVDQFTPIQEAMVKSAARIG